MDTPELRLGYEPDPNGYGLIGASVTSMGFSGSAGFAATEDELRPFLDALAEYPLRRPVRLTVGQFDDGTVIAVAISPSNSRGGLRVDVELRDEWDRTRSVATSLYTIYPDMEAFRVAFARAIRSGGEAILKGEAGRS